MSICITAAKGIRLATGPMRDGWERHPAGRGEEEGRGDGAREPNGEGNKGFSH
ncbi:MAG: hypothetical protein PQJ59_01530 [Spirochaetales bacterium]|nr:hypothetical protein [Spirochaetales bacterium]